MHSDIARILLTEQQLRDRITELGKQLAEDYQDKEPIFIGILKGVIVFFADMVRATQIPCQFDFIVASSYGAGTSTSGTVKILKDVTCDIKGRHVVILEDILDTGLTLEYVCRHLKEMQPASLKICTLLDKPERRKVNVFADYIGYTIPNEFVVGFGLDYDERYRNLPYVGILKPEVYNK